MAWVELNHRPHAYQAASHEHELAQKFLLACLSRTSCSASRAYKNILHFREHFAHPNGHHDGRHCDAQGSEPVHFRDFAFSSSNQFLTTISLSGRGRIIRKRWSLGANAYCSPNFSESNPL